VLRGPARRRIAGVWLLVGLCIAVGCALGFALLRMIPT
jgi:hypothetical protein